MEVIGPNTVKYRNVFRLVHAVNKKSFDIQTCIPVTLERWDLAMNLWIALCVLEHVVKRLNQHSIRKHNLLIHQHDIALTVETTSGNLIK